MPQGAREVPTVARDRASPDPAHDDRGGGGPWLTSRLATLSDDGLAEALRDLGSVLAVPIVSGATDGRDPAARARETIEAAGPGRISWLDRIGVTRPGGRPVRRAAVLAVAVLLLLVAAAAAIGFGLPGLRFVFAPAPSVAVPSTEPSASATPSRSATRSLAIGPPGADLDLGRPVTLAEARR